MADPTPVDQLTFKQASVELEQIVSSLERGDLELEEALGAYGRGVELLTSLRARLADAQQQVSVLFDATQAPQPAAAPQSTPQAVPAPAPQADLYGTEGLPF